MNCPFKPLGADPTLLEFESTDIPPRTPPASPPAGPQQEPSTNTRAFNAIPWLIAALLVAMVVR